MVSHKDHFWDPFYLYYLSMTCLKLLNLAQFMILLINTNLILIDKLIKKINKYINRESKLVIE